MDASDSSDDERNVRGIKKTRLQIDDAPEEVEQSPVEEKQIEQSVKPTKPSMKKKRVSKKPKVIQRKPVSNNTDKPKRKRAPLTGLNGSYWSTTVPERQSTRLTSEITDSPEDGGDESSSSSSSSEAGENEKLQTLLGSSSSSVSDESDDQNPILFSNKTFVTCRSPDDAFFLCQVLQDVYADTKQIRIRWCSLVDENGDETKVDENALFKLDYEDVLDPLTILTAIPQLVRHSDKTLSLKKQDIIETRRLLEKSIKGEELVLDQTNSSMDTTPKKNKSSKKLAKTSETDSTTPKSKKRKLPTDKSRLQSPKKRTKVSSAKSTPTSKQPVSNGDTEDTEGIDEEEKPQKKSPKKTVPKPVIQRKVQLFKVQSNRFLKENTTITIYRVDPFCDENNTVPFISSLVQGKLAIRAVLLNDKELLMSLIKDVKRVASIHISHDFCTDLTPIHYAIKAGNVDMLKILLEDLQSPEEDRCSFPEITMTRQSTGRANVRMLGFRTAPIMASRGAREGNNALNKDHPAPLSKYNGLELLRFALKNNCTREVYDLLCENFENYKRKIYDSIYWSVIAGHRKLAANIISEIQNETFHGFNTLHYQVLLFDNEDLNIRLATSVVKKTRENFQMTPIHCASINPNSKYLKQLLSVVPEYNILDRYERRPIHYAAACEGPEPLEYLLSKGVNFNDVDRAGNSPLHIAVTHGRAINAEILLRTAKEKGESDDADDQVAHQRFGLASINRLNKFRQYPLHLAVMNNHLDCVKVLINFEAQVDALTSTGAEKVTPLMLACQRGNLKIVTYLIESGARVEARDRFKRTPLIHACMCGHAHVVSYLLRIGANAKVCDSSFNTALHYAIAYGWYYCVRLLIEAGATLNCANSWQTTCLAAGFSKGHFGLCDYLLTEHQVDINFKTDDGLTLVMLTAGMKISLSTVQQLEYVVVKHKADCTGVDSNGRNAFHYLAQNLIEQNSCHMTENDIKNLEKHLNRMAQILLDHGCNPNQMDSRAQTPLMISLECDNFVVADFLIEKAKVEINCDISQDGKTLLHYFAMKSDSYSITETLLKMPITEQLKKMGQIVDEDGRSPLHYCVMKFDEFCRENASSAHDEILKKKYRSIVKMIEFCLEKIECDPDLEFKSGKNESDTVENSDNEEEEDDDDGDGDDENDEDEDDDDQELSKNKDLEKMKVNDDPQVKTTCIFLLLRNLTNIDTGIQHPLNLFLTKTKDVNVLNRQNHRTPLLEAIHLHEHATFLTLLQQKSCNINLATSTEEDEIQQTPLIVACKLQSLSIIQELLNHDQCDLLATDVKGNQAFHYLLATEQRSKQYLEIFRLFMRKLKALGPEKLNTQGKAGRTPMHIAVFHNKGTIDSNNDVEQELIENGCDLLVKDNKGNIPLHNVFQNRQVGDDPVDLCVLLVKAMNRKDLDTKNEDGNTPLHLAVINCSTVCVLFLQEKDASLSVENNLSNSIIGSCIVSNHGNLFITFLNQVIDIDLGKRHVIKDSEPAKEETNDNLAQDNNIFNPFQRATFGASIPQSKAKSSARKKLSKKSSMHDSDKDVWEWKYLNPNKKSSSVTQSLIHLIIERDWQGALSLILNESGRFHLTPIQIFEASIINGKLNLTLRLLTRIKDQNQLNMKNAEGKNLFHLISNHGNGEHDLITEILDYLHEYNVEWNIPDKYGSYPLHYACVQQNYAVIDFLKAKHPSEFNLNSTDADGNSSYGLLFWSLGTRSAWNTDKLSSLIDFGKYIDCLCKYENESAMDPLSFGYLKQAFSSKISYPLSKFDHQMNNVRTSPLINAIVHNNFALTKFIVQLGANINFTDEEKRTPLMHAVRQNNIDLVKLLLNKEYTLKIVDPIPPTYHFYNRPTKRKNNHFILGSNTVVDDDEENNSNAKKEEKFIMTSSIDLNAVDALGRTCIHHLVQPFPDGSYTNNIEILKLLHSFGASLTKLDLTGLSPLQYATVNGCQHLCDVLNELIDENTVKTNATIEPFDINDPNEKLFESTDFYHDAQTLIDQHLAAHPPKSFNAAYQVDPLSKMSQTGDVLVDQEKHEPYDVHLTKTDVDYGYFGFYNFYRMQIIKHKSKNNLYILFTRWGRIGGGNGEHQSTPYSDLDECVKEFCKVFREKTGNLWKETASFQVKPKKYTLLTLDQRERKRHSDLPINFDLLQDESKHVSSKLQSPIYKRFFKTLINPQAIRANLNKTRLDIEWMPVSQLRRETLEKAREILDRLKKAIDDKLEKQLKYNQSKTPDLKAELKAILDLISDLSNQYYSIVPSQGYGDEKLQMIDDANVLKAQQNILKDILELELSYKLMLGAQANIKRVSPYDYLYKSINCKFEAMNKDDIDSQLILRYISTSSPQSKIEQVFKIARPDEDRRLSACNVANHHLLWHGTNICNLMSILNRGLLVGPLSARATGSLFGTGIYTADVFSKSLNYCSGVRTKNGERCFMLLCEVALGQIKEVGGDEESDSNEDDDYSKPLDFTKFQSRKGVGNTIPNPRYTITKNNGVRIPLGELISNRTPEHPYRAVEHNEYIVYNEAQVALRYLVQFRR